MHMVRAVVSAVERAGEDRTRLLSRSRIASKELDQHEAWLPLADFRRVVETASELTGDPALGLHFGEQASSVMFQLLAHLVEHSLTLGESLDMIVRYTGLLAQSFEPRIVRVDAQVAVRFPWLCGTSTTVRVMADLALTGLMRLLHQYVGEAADPVAVCFAYPTPARVDEYRRVFGGRERFAQPFTELRFPQAWLSRTQLHSNRELHRLLRSHADRQLALARSETWSARVQQLLAASDARALPAIDSAARTLGVSRSTLTRRLRSELVSYAALLNERRRSAAQELLELPQMTVPEVAEAMGYADPSAFHKAFKRWTGLTPMQYVATR